jgi:cation diffusion facilitator family transporter
MHTRNLEKWQHDHEFKLLNEQGEKRTIVVIVITSITMIVEIIAGKVFGSMALLADGWHMSTHVAAFAITIFAYRYARRNAGNRRFSFGTGKVSVLGGFASAVALAVVALLMALESVERLFQAQEIRFNEAMLVAGLGLIVNLASAFILHQDGGGHAGHDHDDAHDHDHHGHGHHHDHNLKAAYLHVLADALTSVLAIAALLAGKHLGLAWLDPLMGIVGAAVITRWAYGLLQDTSAILLDNDMEGERTQAIKTAIEKDADNRVADIHVWRVSPDQCAAIIAVVTHEQKPPEYYKGLLADFCELRHITIEVNQCAGPSCLQLQN